MCTRRSITALKYFKEEGQAICLDVFMDQVMSSVEVYNVNY